MHGKALRLSQACLFGLSLLLCGADAQAGDAFVCAGALEEARSGERAGKPALSHTTGTRRALALFAHFAGEQGWAGVPDWAASLFDGQRPGSFTHFYHTMSFGKLQIEGEGGPRPYASSRPASAYLATSPGARGAFGDFALEILRQADAELDLSRFDNDGPDGLPDSGDDDGYVDALFIVMASTPPGFLLGRATGMGSLGFDGDFASNDAGASGQAIRVSPLLGSIQQGRTFAEATGALCHEYGHVLGLPDLFNVDFLQSEVALPPEEDSAGIGAWGLMGWGALGWRGDDGPASFSGWSRAELGWTQVLEATRSQKVLRLEDVGMGGNLYRVPVGNGEYFLLENRRRSTHYDRHIPAEGLLVWHVFREALGDRYGRRSRWVVDLECADGRWADAGYPAGQVADPQSGGDNLDFWAHDPAYAQAHAGNLGDATDPFDGERFRRFAPDTNPAAISASGHRLARFEDIRFVEGVAFLQLETEPLFVELQGQRLLDESQDGVVEAGEITRFVFGLGNRGGLVARNLRTALLSRDALVQVLSSESAFGDLGVDRSAVAPLSGGFPSFRVADAFAGTRTVELVLQLFADDALVDEVPLLVPVLSARQRLLETGLVDTLGNGDGRAQPGEFVRPELFIEVEEPALLPALRFRVRALAAGVQPVGSPHLIFDRFSGPRVHSVHAPEFLLSADLQQGAPLDFELGVEGRFSAWRDTFRVHVAAGEDRTPPRVGVPLAVPRGAEVVLSLPAHALLDGGTIRRVEALVYDPAEDNRETRVPLLLAGDVYAGVWKAPSAGTYRIQALAEDAQGNEGHSAPRLFYFSLRAAPPTPPAGAPHRFGRGRVGELAYSPDGRLLAVATSIGTWLYDAPAFGELGLLEGHQAWVTALAFQPGGRLLATGSNDRTVRLWDAERMQEKGVFKGHNHAVTDLAFSEDGQWLASAGWDSKVVIWQVEPPARWMALEDFPRGVTALAWGAERLAAGDWSGALRLWDGQGSAELASWQAHGRGTNDLVFSPDGRLLASAGGDEAVRLWNARDGREEAVLQVLGSAQSARFHRDGRHLFTATREGVLIWDVEQRQPLDRLPQSDFALYIDLGAQGQTLAATGGYPERYARVWDLDGYQILAELEGFTDPVNALALSPDGRLLASGHSDDTIILWERASGQRIATLRGHASVRSHFPGVNGLAFSPDGHTLVSAGGDGTLRLWEVESGAVLAVLGESEEHREIVAAAFSLDGRLVATGESGGTLRLWDLAERRELDVLERVSAYRILALSPDGRRLAYGRSGQLTLRDVVQNRAVDVLQSAGFPFGRIAFSPDGRLLATAGDRPGEKVRLWDAEHLQEIGVLGQVEELVWTLAFSPDSRLLAAGEARGRIRVWDVVAQQPAQSFQAHNDVVHALLFALDGTLFSGGQDGVVRAWPLEASTAIAGEQGALPRQNALLPAYPNPFNAAVSIPFHLARPGPARLRIYNLAGQVVRTLELGAQPAGARVQRWNGRDQDGEEVGSGVYFYRLEAGTWTATRRMVLVK